MIKAVAEAKDGKKAVLIGLSRENCRLLLEGRPIRIDGRDLGLEEVGSIVIMGGETEQSITAELIKHGVKVPS